MTPTPHGQVPAIQRYSIGYHSDEGGVRSLSPTGIYDDAGPWVRYEDHAAALCRLHTESVPAVEREQERIAFKDAHRHLELDEVPDAWGRPMFKHSHVEASWLGWKARASHWQAPAAHKAAQGVGNSGFDYKTAADFLNGKTVSDEAVRNFVATSRWAHDERAALSATLLAMHGVLTSREAEIALLKKALLEAEAAPQPAPAPLSESIDQVERALAIIGVVGAIDGHDVVRRESVLEIARRAAMATKRRPPGSAGEAG